MRFDFSKVDDTRSFVSIPAGIYPCRIAEVRPRFSRDGHPLWSYRLEVDEGEYIGRTAGWDSITWSDRGVFRVKLVLGMLGFDTSGMLELEPTELINRRTLVSFVLELVENPVTGERQERLRVPYSGYQPLPQTAHVAHGGDNGRNGASQVDADEFGT